MGTNPDAPALLLAATQAVEAAEKEVESAKLALSYSRDAVKAAEYEYAEALRLHVLSEKTAEFEALNKKASELQARLDQDFRDLALLISDLRKVHGDVTLSKSEINSFRGWGTHPNQPLPLADNSPFAKELTTAVVTALRSPAHASAPSLTRHIEHFTSGAAALLREV